MGDGDTERDDSSAGPARLGDGPHDDRTVTAKRGREAWTHRRYRLGIVFLGVLGVVFAVAGIVFSATRTLLLALSGVGMFGAVLLYILVPERFVTATLARRTYAPLAEIGPLLIDIAGLTDRQVYVPAGDEVRLVVPSDTVSGDENRMTDGRADELYGGLSLPTTGDGLLAEFHDRGHGPLASRPEELLPQLLDALVEEFELLERASGRPSPEANRATVVVEKSQYGPPTTFDHPVTAFLAAGLAAGLETPVTLDHPEQIENGGYVVECRWQEPIAVEGDDRPSAGEGTADWEFPTPSSTARSDDSPRE